MPIMEIVNISHFWNFIIECEIFKNDEIQKFSDLADLGREQTEWRLFTGTSDKYGGRIDFGESFEI